MEHYRKTKSIRVYYNSCHIIRRASLCYNTKLFSSFVVIIHITAIFEFRSNARFKFAISSKTYRDLSSFLYNFHRSQARPLIVCWRFYLRGKRDTASANLQTTKRKFATPRYVNSIVATASQCHRILHSPRFDLSSSKDTRRARAGDLLE